MNIAPPDSISLIPQGSSWDEPLHIYKNTCFHCKKENVYLMLTSDYYRWKVTKHYAQDVFPDLSHEDRETLISGTHPTCWNEMFPPDED
jgi:hypothetical protein